MTPLSPALPTWPAPLPPTGGPLHRPPTAPAHIACFHELFRGRDELTVCRGRRAGSRSYPPLTRARLADHLAGRATISVYPLRTDGTARGAVVTVHARRGARLQAWDDPRRRAALDARVHAAALRATDALHRHDLRAVLEHAGPGRRRLWCFFAEPAPARTACRLATALARLAAPNDPLLQVAAAPRCRRDDALGTPVCLPLGLVNRAGCWSALLDRDGIPLLNPWPTLYAAWRHDRAAEPDLLRVARLAAPQRPGRP